MKQGSIVDVSKNHENMIAVKEDNGPLIMITIDNKENQELKKLIGKRIEFELSGNSASSVNIFY